MHFPNRLLTVSVEVGADLALVFAGVIGTAGGNLSSSVGLLLTVGGILRLTVFYRLIVAGIAQAEE